MAYTRVNWEDSPSTNTPRNASNLNKMDKGIKDIDDTLTTLSGSLSTVATSGSYNDLSNKPTIPTNNNQLTNGAGYITSSGKSALSSKLEASGGRITNANITHTYENDKAHCQILFASNSMTSNKPASDGYILHFSWDNSSNYDTQFFLPNGSNVSKPLQVRHCNNGTWGSWDSVYKCKNLYNNTSGSTGTITLSESSANFTYIEIFYKDTNGDSSYHSMRMYSPNGKRADLMIITKNDYNTTATSMQRSNTKTVEISGTSITPKSYEVNYITNSTQYNANEISIVRVDGYR